MRGSAFFANVPARREENKSVNLQAQDMADCSTRGSRRAMRSDATHASFRQKQTYR